MNCVVNFFWYWVAKFLAQPKVADWLIARAMKTPYQHIRAPEGNEVYMYRFWLFNRRPTQKEKDALKAEGKRTAPWFPYSIRLHLIMVPDRDRHHHDHPWKRARTVILKGWYVEERLEPHPLLDKDEYNGSEPRGVTVSGRFAGNTAVLNHGEYHRIITVPPKGVWTLFIIGKEEPDDWGYLVDGKKMSFREYVREGTVFDPE